MESHLHEWVNLLLRWIHFILRVAWIGAFFYFSWLENRLQREAPQDEGIALTPSFSSLSHPIHRLG